MRRRRKSVEEVTEEEIKGLFKRVWQLEKWKKQHEETENFRKLEAAGWEIKWEKRDSFGTSFYINPMFIPPKSLRLKGEYTVEQALQIYYKEKK